jgi:C1A family cysteine protease
MAHKETKHSWYGWKKDLPDPRDLKFKISPTVIVPDKIDLSKPKFPIFDQGPLGSCTANATEYAYLFSAIKQGSLKLTNLRWSPSRLFLYYNTRAMEGTISSDSGASIRDTIKCIKTLGVCREELWPYNVDKFRIKPPVKAYSDGLNHQSVSYQSVAQRLNQLQACLAGGNPIVFGFMVYPSFETNEVSRTGIVPLPTRQESPIGGHAVLAVGYDNATKRFKILNSWGKDWADRGYFYLPYEFITNPYLASDFWVIYTVEWNNVVPKSK